MGNYIERNEALAKKLNVVAYIFSAIALSLVVLMRQPDKADLGIDFRFAPMLNACINTGVAVLLVMALYFIKRKNVVAHRRSVFGAMVLSALFLFFYVIYHFTNQETKYCGTGFMKAIYLVILISHIVLAGVSLPLILVNFIKGYCGLVEEHRKMAKWVFPIWLYVAITGPIVFLMLYPCYK
jgi:putative membrane protein